MNQPIKITTETLATSPRVPLGERASLVRRGRRLEYFTIVWNLLEGAIAILSGLIAGSIALVGFGFDSLIEVTSGAALLWRLFADVDEEGRERIEAITLRIVGVCFIALALYVSYDSITTLLHHKPAERSVPGIALAVASLIVMPLLSRAKRRVAQGINSGAMAADAKQTEFCTYLSAILLGGLLLNALFGWWWADPVAALVMAPLMGKEGVEALQGKTCCDGGSVIEVCAGEFVPFQHLVVGLNPNITMRSIRRKILTERGCLHRGVVILLLALIFADLALPQLCCDELNCSTGDNGVTASLSDGGEMNALAAPTDQQEQLPETPKSEKGCFCCCAHILHSSVHVADIPVVRWSPTALTIPFLLSSPPKDLFHPPRSA